MNREGMSGNDSSKTSGFVGFMEIGGPFELTPEKKRSIEVRRQYNNLHAACPKCGGTSIEMTCMGYPFWTSLDHAVDENLCSCECGWNGIRHDMVPLSDKGAHQEAKRRSQPLVDWLDSKRNEQSE